MIPLTQGADFGYLLPRSSTRESWDDNRSMGTVTNWTIEVSVIEAPTAIILPW